MNLRSTALAVPALLLASALPARAAEIPATNATALDGHAVALPAQLPARATVLILGFSQHSKDNTTAWEIPTRRSLATLPAIGYYDIAFLEDAPSLIRPIILRSIRKEVPDVLKPSFLPLTSGQAAWKQTVGFSPAAPDAAYVLLVDRAGNIRWQTHDPFSPALFDQLSQAARALSAQSH